MAPFPAAVEDVKCAVRWFRANAAKYKVDPNRIGGFGHSAGGHLVSMLALVPKSAKLEGDGPNQDQSSAIQAGVIYSGPADLTAGLKPGAHRAYKQFLIGVENAGSNITPQDLQARAKKASPVTYVTKDAPPLLIIHGVRDATVRIEQADALVKLLKEAKTDVTYIRKEDGGHALLNETDLATKAKEFLKQKLMPAK